MAHAPSTVRNPLTEEALTADRQRMFDGFCSATVISAVSAIIIVGLMGLFLL